MPTQTLPKVSTQRNSGIDLLRVLAAYYIVVLHIMGAGGFSDSIGTGSFRYYLFRGILTWTYCAVNTFGIISGYVGYTDQDRPANFRAYGRLWLEVVFYDISFLLLTRFLQPGSVDRFSFLFAFFPVTQKSNWYFTAYSCLFLFIPLLNSAVRHSSEKTLMQFLLGVMLLLAPIESLFAPFHFRQGYSPVWLILLYLIGAMIKKTQLSSKISPRIAVFGLAGSVLFTYLVCVTPFQADCFGIRLSSQLMEQYVFPGHLLTAICYVLLFSHFRFSGTMEKLIRFAAPGSFAIYLIHTQDIIWNRFIRGQFTELMQKSAPEIVLRILGTALALSVSCLILDSFRRRLFGLFRKRTG